LRWSVGGRIVERMDRFDVAVIGGGAAGLSAAAMLGRARRCVVVIDAGRPRNAPASAVHGFLTRDGMPPTELLAAGRVEVERYGGVLLPGEATEAHHTDGGFAVSVAGGEPLHARRLLVASGLVDELPDISGVRERWGRDVLHCPYCHGWEVRDRAIGVLGTGPLSVHQALLLRQWTPDVMLFTHTTAGPNDDEREQLSARGIRVVEGTVADLDVVDDALTGVRLADGTVVARQAVAVAPHFVARSPVLDSLGLSPVRHPRGFGEYYPTTDPTGRTAVPGVWVAGNVTDLAAQVVMAAAGGATAAAAINADLVDEDTRAAVDAVRRLFTREFWDERYGSTHRVWSGNPNPHLVTTATELAPATALDVGCGEGADAIWLAAHGWRVTGIDVSTAALDRAAKHAVEAGAAGADRIAWQQADVLSWDPAPQRYDLVSAHFMQLPTGARQALHRRLAAAVRPGGTLLIVGHHPSDLDTTAHRLKLPDTLFTAEQAAAALDPNEWTITASTPARPATDPDGHSITIHDAVLHAVRA
jgi:thioredoxin reductase/SAM-dependent methyltransferase